LEGLAIEDVGIFYVHLIHFTAIWYILWHFGIFYGYLVYVFYPVLIFLARKSGSPGLNIKQMQKKTKGRSSFTDLTK
jgi:hypothetical protein